MYIEKEISQYFFLERNIKYFFFHNTCTLIGVIYTKGGRISRGLESITAIFFRINYIYIYEYMSIIITIIILKSMIKNRYICTSVRSVIFSYNTNIQNVTRKFHICTHIHKSSLRRDKSPI